MQKQIRNINEVVQAGLCTQCGVCYGTCPKHNIEAKRDRRGNFFPKIIDESQCGDCGVCLKVCGGSSVDFQSLNRFVFGRGKTGESLGRVCSVYAATSAIRECYEAGSSGGALSTFLIFLLEKKIIDGVFLVKLAFKRAVVPQIVLARTKYEILGCANSKYMQLPWGSFIRELRSSTGRYAVVGLPCYIHSLRNAQTHMEWLKERLAVVIGLFDCVSMGWVATEHILTRLGLKAEEVVHLKYRNGEKPGGMLIKTNNEKQIWLSNKDYGYSHTLFCLPRCLLCPEITSELADISFGSIWQKEIQINEKKWSFVITRTPVMDTLFKEMVKEDKAILISLSPQDIINANKPWLFFKKQRLVSRLKLRKILGKRNPVYKGISAHATYNNLYGVISAAIFSLVVTVTNVPFFARILARFSPKQLRKLTHLLFKMCIRPGFRKRKI